MKNYVENMCQKLVPDPLLNLVNSPKQPIQIRNYLADTILEENYQKSLKIKVFFFFDEVHFKNTIRKSKSSLELVPTLFSGLQICSEVSSQRCSNFNVLIQSGFWVIQKIAFANLCKPYHGIVIIWIFSFHFESKNVGEQGGEIEKIWISGKHISKTIFQKNFKGFLSVKYTK